MVPRRFVRMLYTAAAWCLGVNNLLLLTRADNPIIATKRFPSAPFPLPNHNNAAPFHVPVNQLIPLPDWIGVRNNWVAQVAVRNPQDGCQASLRTRCTNCQGGCAPYRSNGDVMVSAVYQYGFEGTLMSRLSDTCFSRLNVDKHMSKV